MLGELAVICIMPYLVYTPFFHHSSLQIPPVVRHRPLLANPHWGMPTWHQIDRQVTVILQLVLEWFLQFQSVLLERVFLKSTPYYCAKPLATSSHLLQILSWTPTSSWLHFCFMVSQRTPIFYSSQLLASLPSLLSAILLFQQLFYNV